MTKIILLLHIVSGFAALFAGFTAVLSRKKRGLHSMAGNVFFYGMTISLIFALGLNVIRFSPFLFPIALFTLYMITGGKLIFSIRVSKLLGQWWRIYLVFGLFISLLMLGLAMFLFFSNNIMSAIILGVFGIIQSLMTFSDWKNNPSARPKNRIFQHINKMGGGMIAAVTAFAAVNFEFLPPLIVWLTPSLIGSILIGHAIRQRRRTSS